MKKVKLWSVGDRVQVNGEPHRIVTRLGKGWYDVMNFRGQRKPVEVAKEAKES